MIRNQTVRTALSALAILVFGFILLNATFILYVIWGSLLDLVFGADYAANHSWFLILQYVIFLIIIGLISWLVLRSKIRPIYKAIFSTVPFAAGFVTIGIFLFSWPVAVYSISALAAIATLYYFYRTQKIWFYWFALIAVALALGIFTSIGGDI